MKNPTNEEKKQNDCVVHKLRLIDRIQLNHRKHIKSIIGIIGLIITIIVLLIITNFVNDQNTGDNNKTVPTSSTHDVQTQTTVTTTDMTQITTSNITTTTCVSTISTTTYITTQSSTTTSKPEYEFILMTTTTYSDDIQYDSSITTYSISNQRSIIEYSITTEDIQLEEPIDINDDYKEYDNNGNNNGNNNVNTSSGLTSLNYITEAERVMLCNVVGGEYGSDWISIYDKACVVACIMNRYYDGGWQGYGRENTIYNVITAPGQFEGYYGNTYYNANVTESCINAVEYYFENQSSFPHYTSFYGDGIRNYFS